MWLAKDRDNSLLGAYVRTQTVNTPLPQEDRKMPFGMFRACLKYDDDLHINAPDAPWRSLVLLREHPD